MRSCSKCLFNEENHTSIVFDKQGVCDICLINEKRISGLEIQRNPKALKELIESIKSSRKGKYDCLIGISGGTDSTFLVCLAKTWGLNPLLMHVDGGWNSETSVINIERIVEKSQFDFVSEILPWHEMRDIQKAFIQSNVIDIDLPFDNAMLKYNYIVARKHGIKYILNGYSTSTEGIMPGQYNHYKYDKRNIHDIHNKFGRIKLKKLKFLSSFQYIWYDRISKIKFVHPLDYFDYNKQDAKQIIEKEYDWKDYGGKHYENVFTRFYQGHILTLKFNIDKRISHLSMLICSDQITKEEALHILFSSSPYPNSILERDDELFFCKKLQLSKSEFDSYMSSQEVSHRKYKSDLDWYDFLRPIYRFFKKIFGLQVFKN